ncbi:MAG: S8 family serine peptidase [Candidatus Woesearchaeota archaeon]
MTNMKLKEKLNIYLFLMILLIYSSFVFAEPDNPKIDEDILVKLNSQDKVLVEIILNDRSLNPNLLVSSLSESEFKARSYGSDGGWIFGEVSLKGLNKLKRDLRINSINIPQEYRTMLPDSKGIINVRDVWDLGYKGEGQAVCVIDSGIDTNHPAFSGRIVAERCYCSLQGGCCPDDSNQQNGTGSAEDDDGHGTHVSGIIAADFIVEGVAKEANIVSVKVCNSTGSCDPIGIPEAIQWCRQSKDTYDIAAISMSLGSDTTYTDPSICDTHSAGIEVNRAYDIEKISVIAASGNDGETNGISSPACASGAISVGASTKSDNMWSSTNRDEILDLLAPGTYILSTWHSFPYYNILSGTSMATPHVSGSIALLKEADDTNSVTNSPMHIRELLKESGKQIYDSDADLLIPRLDIFKAFGIDWPYFHHDLRRTGFTLLKGDLDEDDIDQASFVIDYIDNTFVDFPVIADVNGDDEQEILVGTSRFGSGDQLFGAFFALECIKWWGRCSEFRELWMFTDGTVLGEAPSVDDLNGDERKEVVFITLGGPSYNGIVYAFDANKRGGFLLEPRHALWKYHIENISEINADVLHSAVADVDLDGNKEVLVTDYYGYVGSPTAYFYVLEVPNSGKTFNLKQSKIAIGTGAPGAIAIANINSTDDYPEIIVPSAFGIYAYRYDGNQLVEMWSNSHAELTETALIADVDADNDYEIVYATSDYDSYNCDDPSVTCTRKLYVVDALTGNVECSTSTLSEHPISSPAVGNLDSDKELEIAIVTRNTLGSGSSYGHIRTFEHNCNSKNTYPSANNLDTQRSSADIADIDNDGNNDVIFSAKNGTIYVMNNNLNLKWTYYLGGEIVGTPAIGDIDGDGTLEIAAKHVQEGAGGQGLDESFTRVYDRRTFRRQNITFEEFSLLNSADNVVDIIGGNNSQPELGFIDDVYAIEEDFINVTATGSDADNDELIVTYSSPLNDTGGEWNTTINDSGTYEVFVEVSDGNLTDSQFFSITLFEGNTIFNDTFLDGSTEKNFTYESPGDNNTIGITILENSTILRAAFDLSGHTIDIINNSFQEPDPVIIEINEFNGSNSSNLIDKDFGTFYSAGSATGAIVEIRDLDVPSEPAHIVFHLKLRVFGGGIGRFGIYNYETEVYEIVTSSILPFSESSRDFYFDVYEEGNDPLGTVNDTYFVLRVENISKYISVDKVRWYYRYLGEWASQKIYESEVKFDQKITFPESISIDVGNDGVSDITIDGVMHEKIVSLDSFNNSNRNETFEMGINSSVIRYVDIPKNALLSEAFISVGEKEVGTLSEYSFDEMQLEFEKDLLKKDMFSYGYKNEDGSYSRIIYNAPVNYFDGTEYKPIDTEIVSSADDNFEVTKGIYKAFFSDAQENKPTIRVEIDDSHIEYILDGSNYLDLNKIRAKTDNNKIIYENIFENIDLEYIYNPTSLKENFIIREPINLDENTLYLEFNFKIKNTLDIYVEDDLFNNGIIETNDKILFKDGNDLEFSFFEPYAYDASNNKETLIYRITKNQNETTISILVPASLLHKADYPLIIDPTTNILVSAYGHCESDDDCLNTIVIGSSTIADTRASVKFSLSSLPGYQSTTIDEAKVRLTATIIDTSNNCVLDDNTDVHWEDNDNHVPPTSWSQLSVSDPQLDRHCLDDQENIPIEWNVLGNGIDGFEQDYESGDDDSSYIIKFQTEGHSTPKSADFSASAYLNVTYTVGHPPELVGCRDDFTLMNSDGSDISVDLWECFIDPDTNASDATFTIESETNTALIDCSISNNRYIGCSAPASNSVGFSDINISASDWANSDNDTIRISVKPPGYVSMIVNDVVVWNNLNFAYDEVGILREMSLYLEQCSEDVNGNCQVPINITAHDYNVNFTINSLDIEHNLREVGFSDALQDYVNTSCSSESCEVTLRFSSNSKGRLNVSDLQLFYYIKLPITITVISPLDQTYIEPTVQFNISISEPMDLCVYSFNSGVLNYTMTELNSMYYHDTNSTMSDGSHSVIFYCNDISNTWYESNSTQFYVDIENVTICRDLTVAGRNYTLVNDITTTSATACFEIKNESIELDCIGKSIEGDNINTPTGIHVGGYNRTIIKNCNINKFKSNSIFFRSNNGTIENNTIKDGSGFFTFGIFLDDSNQNNITGNVVKNLDGYGVNAFAMSDSNNNIFVNNIAVNNTGSSFSYGFNFGGNNNQFINTIVHNHSTYGIAIQGNNTLIKDYNSVDEVKLGTSLALNTTFINAVYDSEVVDPGSELIRKWYFDAQVNDTNGNPLNQANITGKNVTNSVQFSELTDTDGKIERREVIEYINNGGTKTYYTDYAIKSKKDTYATDLRIINITTNQDLQITLATKSDFIFNLSEIYQNVPDTLRIFKFTINNTVNSTDNFTWQFDLDESVINSDINFTLLSNETIFNFIEYNFTKLGSHEIEAIVKSGNYSDSETINVTI